MSEKTIVQQMYVITVSLQGDPMMCQLNEKGKVFVEGYTDAGAWSPWEPFEVSVLGGGGQYADLFYQLKQKLAEAAVTPYKMKNWYAAVTIGLINKQPQLCELTEAGADHFSDGSDYSHFWDEWQTFESIDDLFVDLADKLDADCLAALGG